MDEKELLRNLGKVVLEIFGRKLEEHQKANPEILKDHLALDGTMNFSIVIESGFDGKSQIVGKDQTDGKNQIEWVPENDEIHLHPLSYQHLYSGQSSNWIFGNISSRFCTEIPEINIQIDGKTDEFLAVSSNKFTRKVDGKNYNFVVDGKGFFINESRHSYSKDRIPLGSNYVILNSLRDRAVVYRFEIPVRELLSICIELSESLALDVSYESFISQRQKNEKYRNALGYIPASDRTLEYHLDNSLSTLKQIRDAADIIHKKCLQIDGFTGNICITDFPKNIEKILLPKKGHFAMFSPTDRYIIALLKLRAMIMDDKIKMINFQYPYEYNLEEKKGKTQMHDMTFMEFLSPNYVCGFTDFMYQHLQSIGEYAINIDDIIYMTSVLELLVKNGSNIEALIIAIEEGKFRDYIAQVCKTALNEKCIEILERIIISLLIESGRMEQLRGEARIRKSAIPV